MQSQVPARTVVVTGASSGIGRAVAEMLSTSYHVVLVARRGDVLAELAARLGAYTNVVATDLTVESELRAAAESIGAEHPTIDGLVNCAGARPERLLSTLPFDEIVATWTQQVAVNLTSAALFCFALAPRLRRPGGRIVNIGSIAAVTGGRRPGSAGYAAAKAGLHGLTLGLSRELAPQGITVNTIAPGFVTGTEFTGGWGPEITGPLVAETPAGRAGEPSDIAAAVAYLLSPAAAFVTGQSIAVNGGMR